MDAIDATAATYNDFSQGAGLWKNAMVYDKKLIEYYGVTGESERNARYSLRTVKQLGDTTVVETADAANPMVDFVATHYGDWPAPEIFVLNTKSSG